MGPRLRAPHLRTAARSKIVLDRFAESRIFMPMGSVLPSVRDDDDSVEVLRERVRRLQAERDLLLDHVSDGFWDWHIPTDYEYMSPRFWEIFGEDPAQKRPHPSEWQQLIHPDDLARVMATFEAHVASRGQAPYDELVRYRHAEGHWVTVRCRGKVVEWADDGSPVRMIGTHTDVTELMEARSRAEIVYSGASVGFWDWIEVGEDKEYWTPRFYELLGYTPEELPASLTSFQSILHPDDTEHTFAAVRAHLERKEPFDVEYRLRCKTGEYRWFQGYGQAVFDGDGRPIRMVGSIQDIHPRKVAERELEAMSLRHELSLRTSNIGVWDFDLASQQVIWDPQMYRLYGLGPGSVEPDYGLWSSCLHPDDRASAELAVQRSLAEGTDLKTEFRVVWPGGEVRHLRCIATPVTDDCGEVARLVGVNWDITDYRRTHDALRLANDDLTQFAYRTSHDLKAPLISIQGLLRIMREDIEDGDFGEVRSNAERVEAQAEKLEHLVDDLLSLSRADLAQTEWAVVCIRELLSAIEANTRAAYPSTRVAIRLRSDGPFARPIPKIRLEQIGVNLVSNGVKYFDPGKANPWVELVVRDCEDHLSITVRDNGRGIPPEHHDHLFGLFQRFHPDAADGSGLGMSIVKRNVDRLNGTITFESSPAGTTFMIHIPYPLSPGDLR